MEVGQENVCCIRPAESRVSTTISYHLRAGALELEEVCFNNSKIVEYLLYMCLEEFSNSCVNIYTYPDIERYEQGLSISVNLDIN